MFTTGFDAHCKLLGETQNGPVNGILPQVIPDRLKSYF